MAEIDQETRREIEFFVRDNLSRTVEEIFDDGTTIVSLRAWLETEAADKIAEAKRQRICELADELSLGEDTRLGDIRAQVGTDVGSE